MGAAIPDGCQCHIENSQCSFKIPLTYILHEEGMAVFGTAFQIYMSSYIYYFRISACRFENVSGLFRAAITACRIFPIVTVPR